MGGAEEISQNVFRALARKAWQFAPDDSRPAWLHKTALREREALELPKELGSSNNRYKPVASAEPV